MTWNLSRAFSTVLIEKSSHWDWRTDELKAIKCWSNMQRMIEQMSTNIHTCPSTKKVDKAEIYYHDYYDYCQIFMLLVETQLFLCLL